MLFISTILTCIVCLAFHQIALATSGTPETALSLGIPCNTCGLCTAPLGICILYYILAALVIILLVLLLTARGRRCPICKERCSRKDHLCPKCGYDFDAGLQSTLSLRVEDSPELMALRNANKETTPTTHHIVEHIPANQVGTSEPTANAEQNTTQTQHVCPRCGAAVVNPKALFCGKCGQRLR